MSTQRQLTAETKNQFFPAVAGSKINAVACTAHVSKSATAALNHAAREKPAEDLSTKSARACWRIIEVGMRVL